MFNYLFASFTYFMIADKYEYFLELMRQNLKSKPVNLELFPELEVKLKMLKSFMIVLDIHVYLKNHCWIGAADSMFNFLNSVFSYISFKQKVSILENAIYLIMMAKFGVNASVYLPDYVCCLLDITHDFTDFYLNLGITNFGNDESPVLKREQSIEYSRSLISREITGFPIEAYKKEELYNEGFYWTNKILKELN